MLVYRHFVYVRAGKLIHLAAPPVIIRVVDIFHSPLRLDLVRDTPRRRAAASAFLGNGKSNALVKGPGNQRHLPGIGTPGHRQMTHVDGQRINGLTGGELYAIDQAAHSPRPCSILS